MSARHAAPSYRPQGIIISYVGVCPFSWQISSPLSRLITLHRITFPVSGCPPELWEARKRDGKGADAGKLFLDVSYYHLSVLGLQ